MFMNYNIKKEKYIELILELFDLPESEEKRKKLSEALTKYSIFCYKHNLDKHDERLDKRECDCYLIDSEPIMDEVNKDEIEKAARHLKDVLENGGGISPEEANILLKGSVFNARVELAKTSLVEFKKDSLERCCGQGQALTLLPFMNIGAKCTINNAHYFPFCQDYHAFGTVFLPILNNGVVTEERYLIDVTYRQYYKILDNNEGNYYTNAGNRKNKTGPYAGYYTVKYPGGREVASKLLKEGFIKITPGVIKAYGVGFTAEGLNITNKDALSDIFKIKEGIYLLSILDNNDELDYNEEEKAELSEQVNFIQDTVKRS